MKMITALLLTLTIVPFAQAAKSNQMTEEVEAKASREDKGEVLDNPTLKTLSGSLSNFSFYSSFNYKAGPLDDPMSPERPNITNADEKPNLQSLSGRVGAKYRLSEKDNLSLRVGTYMASPFHSSHDAKDPRVQQEFDNNHQQFNVDDPRLSYFRTYYLGPVQNVTFTTFELTTTEALSNRGYFGNFTLSHAGAIRLAPRFYVAGTLSATQIFFDKDSAEGPFGRTISLRPFQTERLYKGSLSMEYYPIQDIALRAITDVASYFQTRDEDFGELEKRDLQQTIAMTYFFTRDISIAPNIKFIADDIRAERTNVGMNFNVNL